MARKEKEQLDPSIGAMIDAIRKMEHVASVQTGKYIKYPKKRIGPGYYFYPLKQKTIEIVVVGERVCGVGLITAVTPYLGYYDNVVHSLIQYRLDGYGKGTITRNDGVKRLLGYLLDIEKNVKVTGLGTRSEPWRGPGYYNIKKNNGFIDLLVSATEKPGVGLSVRATPQPRNKEEVIYFLKTYKP
ncbi:MAG: hypothetical protein QXK37_03750 [Candidatus Woesearchaeota archaeon]